MKNITEYIEIKNILEDIDNIDNKYYVLKKSNNEYNIYFDKHVLNRKHRHFDWDGTNNISDKLIISKVENNFNKIIDKYNSNKLHYCKDGKEAFLLTTQNKLNIIGFIYKLDKNSEKYDICIKTVMYNDDFIPKNNSTYRTIKILVESIDNIIIIKDE